MRQRLHRGAPRGVFPSGVFPSGAFADRLQTSRDEVRAWVRWQGAALARLMTPSPLPNPRSPLRKPPPRPGKRVLNGREEAGDARAPRHTLHTYDVHAARCPVWCSSKAAQPRLGRSPDRGRAGALRCRGKPFTRSSAGSGMRYRLRWRRRSSVRITIGTARRRETLLSY
jgi:hypothetical protein